jgi:TPR repeat protein
MERFQKIMQRDRLTLSIKKMTLQVFICVTWFSLTVQPSEAGPYDLAIAALALAAGDTVSGQELLTPLAEANDATAELLLGRLYLARPSASPDEGCEGGVKWLLRSAEQGNTEAAMQLADVYLRGDCVARNEANAVRWYARAADDGDPDAPEAIGELYLHRGTAEPDLWQAERWFLFGANRLNPSACYHLGLMHARGIGMPADQMEGYVWLDVAVNLAPYYSEILESALRERDRVRELLTPIQVRNAGRRADELLSLLFSGYERASRGAAGRNALHAAR